MRQARQQVIELAGIRRIAVREPVLHAISVVPRRCRH
jgi:hypothetical protein